MKREGVREREEKKEVPLGPAAHTHTKPSVPFYAAHRRRQCRQGSLS